MKKNLLKGVLIAVLLLILATATGAFYTVPRRQFVAVRQFGRIVRVVETPGLKFKVPFIQSIQRIPACTNIFDIPASDVITKDKKSMIADDFVLWRVVNPTRYIQSLNATEARAQERIEAAVYNATKTVISSMTQDEVIESRGERLIQMITEDSNNSMTEYGIDIELAQIKALDLPADNKEAVYTRMISERQNIAAQYEAEGNSEKQKIINQTDRQVAVMKAQAEKEAAIIEAEGEAAYMAALQEAYNTQDKADFYNFIRSLDALKASLSGDNKTIVLDKDSELAKILYGSALE